MVRCLLFDFAVSTFNNSSSSSMKWLLGLIRYEGKVQFFATHDDKIGNVIDVVVLMIQFLLLELVLDLSKQKAVQQRNLGKADC